MKKITSREKIINSAYGLFYKQGYNGTSIDEILKDAGLNKGSLYHFFKGKKELLLAVINERIAYAAEKRYKDIATLNNPLEFLQQKLLKADNFDFRHGCALNNLVQELSSVDDDIAKALLDVYSNLEHSYYLALRDLNLSKSKKESLAKMMLATVEGAIMAAKAAQDKAPYLEIVQQLFVLISQINKKA